MKQITYIKVGDYFIPDWKLPEEQRPIGRWGRMHRDYLKEHRPVVFNQLVLSGNLWTYLADINEQAHQRMEVLVKQMMASESVTEELKETNQIEWVQRMYHMADRKAELSAKEKELTAKITEAQNRIAEVNVLKTQIVNYSKTRDVYVAYRKSGYSKKFYDEHEDDIIIHKAAKKAFDELGVKKLPTIKSLQVEFADLLTAKKEAYAELKKVRDELRDVAVQAANYEELRDLAERDPRKEKEHGRE